ncbi:MAG TPA: MMPL family transporter [Thermomicrobiales bacterium]|nr:MMPL family transporter [Thermomicrobiales bacterium]
MFSRIGTLACRFRFLVIAIWAAVILGSLPFLIGIEDSLKVGGFSSRTSEGSRALSLLESELGYSPSSFVLIYQSERLEASDPEFLAQVERSVEDVRALPFVEDVLLPTLDETLIASSGRAAYAIVGIDLPPEEAQRYVDAFQDAIREQPDLTIILAGAPAFYADIETASQRDLRRAELIALPFALIALLFVFGSVAAAVVPLVIGCASVAVILLTIRGVAQFADISIFALNLATMLGLGLAVDYCLFVTSRFREERISGAGSTDDAVVVAVSRAGRAVFFSGTSVLIGLAGLTLFPLMFLRSVGIAGVIVVAISTIAALTLLPAVLSLIGDRIERFPIGPLARRSTDVMSDHGFWHGLAERVMKRPVIVAVLTAGLLAALGLPFLNANISSPDATILPRDLPSRQGFDIIASEYSGGEISPFVIALQSRTSMFEPANLRTVNSLVRLLERDERIARIQSPVTLPGAEPAEQPALVVNARQLLEVFGTDTRLDSFINDRTAVILAYPVAPANDPANKDLLRDLRSVDPGGDVSVVVGGGTAEIVDVVDVIYRNFPLVATLIIGSTFLVLLVLFRSIALPIKAILMNIMSILASYGALVWIFQEGNLSEYLGFTPQGFVEASLPVIMFCVLFGLSMDYEVFLLSRIQEEWLSTGENDRSVAVGLQRSGRIISSAALIVVVVTASFVSADVVLVKALGLGIALAVALDATVVRALLVPATMKLLGNANWWVPAWLGRVLPKTNLSEH